MTKAIKLVELKKVVSVVAMTVVVSVTIGIMIGGYLVSKNNEKKFAQTTTEYQLRLYSYETKVESYEKEIDDMKKESNELNSNLTKMFENEDYEISWYDSDTETRYHITKKKKGLFSDVSKIKTTK